MKTMLFKHIFMKIRQNYKRFLSLLFMALLGIGFYAGIEACSPDMLKTLDKFYDDNDVYDIMIISNLGLNNKDVDSLSEIDGNAESVHQGKFFFHCIGTMYVAVFFHIGTVVPGFFD